MNMYKELYQNEYSMRVSEQKNNETEKEQNERLRKELRDLQDKNICDKFRLLSNKKTESNYFIKNEGKRIVYEKWVFRAIYGAEFLLSLIAIGVYLKYGYNKWSRIEPILAIPGVFILNRFLKMIGLNEGLENFIVRKLMISYDLKTNYSPEKRNEIAKEIEKLEQEIQLLQFEN